MPQSLAEFLFDKLAECPPRYLCESSIQTWIKEHAGLLPKETPRTPYIYEDLHMDVYENGSGEIFIKLKAHPSGQIRITPMQNSLVVTCHDGTLTPGVLHGLTAFSAWPGKIAIQKET